MRKEDDKAKIELDIFRRFAEQIGLSVLPGSIAKGDANAHEPDILYLTTAGEQRACELMEACNPEFAELRTSGRKHPSVTHFAWGASSVAKTVRKKTGRRYSVRFPIDLLVCTDGNTAELGDLVKGQIEVGLSRGRGQFVQVWLWAGEICEIGTAT